MSYNGYRAQISRGGATHGVRHGGETLCGKRYITALNWNVAETVTCKSCLKVLAKADKASEATSGPIVIDYWASLEREQQVTANLAKATGLAEKQIRIVTKCKCCQARPVPARTGDPRQDGVLAVCEQCAIDLCPGSDVKRYNELVAQYGW